MIRVAACVLALAPVLTAITSTLPEDVIKIRQYSSDGNYSDWSLEVAGELFMTNSYNSTLDLIMIILGYDTHQNSMIQQTVQALMSRKLNERYNILAVILPPQFSFSVNNLYYLRPASNVPSAGKALGQFVNAAMVAGRVSAGRLDVISFSLGAQIAGYMAREVNALIRSIAGVDPLGIGFDWSSLVTQLIHVSKDDAQFVHLYHSNSAEYGTTLRLGTADYLFNTGETQPGCRTFDPMCSHLRGFFYFLEALHTTPGLPAVQCYRYSHLQHCKCRGNKLSYVGFPLDHSAHGMYVLQTREFPPYNLGNEGLKGTKCRKEKDFAYKLGKRYDKIMHYLE